MKRFYLIIFLLLLPVCQAQGQSIQFHLAGDAIPYSFEWDCSYNGGPYFDSMQMTGTIPVGCDLAVVPNVQDLLVTFSVASKDTTISFTIDPAAHLIRQFNLFCITQNEGPKGHNCRYGITIDSLPFTGDTGTIIVAPGPYLATYADALGLSTSENGYACDGGTSNQGTTWVTTLDLQCSIPALATVASSVQVPAAFRVIATPEGLIAKYTSSDFTRSVEIVNSIGVCCMRTTIAPQSEENHLPSLSRGCYFARLGTEIAKFYVLE
jgi:hypothetical protein